MPVINIDNAAFQHDAQAQFDAELHIDAVFSIDKYVTPNGTNTLIEGIRGTGKTHMLKMISTRIIERFSDIRVLPVYISLAEVSEYVTKDPALFRVHFYSTLIIRTIETIKNNRQQIEFKEDNVLLQLTKQFAMLFGFFEEDNFDTLLDKIESYAEGLQREILTNPTKISEITKSVEECAAGVKSPGIQVDAKRNDETSHSLEYITIKLAHLNASQFMTEFFKYLHSVLRLRHTMLLVDECSDLPQEGQIEVFRLFKLIRGGTRIDNSRNFLYFIGGVYPPQATCYPSKALGSSFDFEPGDDCAVEYLELDVQLDFYEEFFKNLLLAKLRKFHKNQYSNIGDIFEDDRSFLLATYASHGLPRRFFEILHQSYENLIEFAASRPIQDNRVYKIRYSDVTAAIDKIVNTTILSSRKFTKQDLQTLESISNTLKRRNKKVDTEAATKTNYVPINFYFTCPRSKEDLIGNLIAKGVLHNQSRTRSLKHTIDGLGGKGLVIMVDLSISYSEGVIPNKLRAVEYFQKDTRLSAKNGYEYCQTIQL